MKIRDITENDINNGPGFRTSVWISGCSIKCPGCHNQSLWNESDDDFILDSNIINQICTMVSKDHCDGLSILGGEPIKIDNKEDLEWLITLTKEVQEKTWKTIWLYTGYTLSQLIEKIPDFLKRLLENVDVIVDGPYIERLRDVSIAFRGSLNQNIINKESIINRL